MTSIKYLCIDDQQDSTVDTLLRSITGAGGPIFERRTPTEVGAQIDLILEQALANNGRFGVLLDLRLDMEADSDGNKVPYRGPTLAQELRTRMVEGASSTAFPIVLWSIATKFKNSYVGEDTSHDLFDAVYGKDVDISNSPDRVGVEMCALAAGYFDLSEAKRLGRKSCEILNISKRVAEGVCLEFADELDSSLRDAATHYCARLIMSELLLRPGLLVDERLLAARLGLDMDASGVHWSKLRDEHLSSAKYSGPFSSGWSRWWWSQIEDWWASLGDASSSLRRLSAENRVNILNKSLNIELVPASPIEPGYSEKFFTLCAATNRPMDPMDGFRISVSSSKSWQDTVFVSTYAALNRINKEKWGRIHPSDRERFDSIKGMGRK